MVLHSSRYWQVQLDESSKDSLLNWPWTVAVQSHAICNGPGTFERLIEQVLAGLSLSTALVYLDDILVPPGQSFSHDITNLQKVFERLRICKAEALTQEVSSLK